MALTRVTDKQITFKNGGSGSVVRNLGDKLRESVSVLDFGADPSASAAVNDAAFAAAIAYADTIANGLNLYIPAGVYQVSQTITVPNVSYVSLNGAGRRNTVLDWRGANDGKVVEFVSTNYLSTNTDLFIKDLTISNTIGATGVTGLQVGGTYLTPDSSLQMEVGIENLLIRDVATSLYINGECNEVLIKKCWFFDFTTGCNFIQSAHSVSNITMLGNSWAVGSNAAVCVNWTGGSRMTAIGNTMQGASANFKGYVLDKFDAVIIDGNYYENATVGNAGPAIHLGTTAYPTTPMSGARISGSHFDFGSGAGTGVAIKVDYAKGVEIHANSYTATYICHQITANAGAVHIGQNSYGDNITSRTSADAATYTSLVISERLSRPMFSAKSLAQANVTGSGAAYQVIYNTELVDSGVYDNTTGRMTAPFKGMYQFNASLGVVGLDAAMTSCILDIIHFNSSNAFQGAIKIFYGNPYGTRDVIDGAVAMNGGGVLAMNSGDYCYVRLIINGSGATADIEAGHYFSGYML